MTHLTTELQTIAINLEHNQKALIKMISRLSPITQCEFREAVGALTLDHHRLQHLVEDHERYTEYLTEKVDELEDQNRNLHNAKAELQEELNHLKNRLYDIMEDDEESTGVEKADPQEHSGLGALFG